MTTAPSHGTDLCELFAQTAEQCAQNLAVDHPDGCLTYRELDEASSAFASTLKSVGVSDGTPVLLVTAHGTFNIIAILAILKAGGFFVPVDRGTWSPDTIQYVFDTVDSQVAVNTTPEPFASPGGRSCHVLHITQLPQAHARPNEFHQVARPTRAERTACTIFTSGSTGRAKGVMISHRSLALYAKMSPANLDIRPGDRLLHLLSVAFDACACVLFSALLNGGTVVPAQADEVCNRSSSCTVMASTPSLLSHLPKPVEGEDGVMYPKLHTILLGGETPTSDLLQSWTDAGVRVLMAYGATETTSMGCIREVELDGQTGAIVTATIGSPMALSQVWLMDEDLGIVEDDLVEGEIIIAGQGVAQGYYKDEARTAVAFISWNGQRVYRTGDYGRWVRAGGCDQGRALEFRGRKDRTVKNRGFLVNLDRDVEDGLLQAGASLGVKSVRAALTQNGIVAVVSPSCVDTAALLIQARHSMSAYCVPYRVEAVDDLPLSPNGKAQLRGILDIIAAINEGREGGSATVAPSSVETKDMANAVGTEEAEGKLAKVLRAASEVLRQAGEGSRGIQAENTFIEVGGSSLLALKLVSALRQLNLSVSARDLLGCRKFSEIARIASTTMPAFRSPEKDSAAAQMLADFRTQARRALRLATDEEVDAGPLTSLQLELAMPTLADASKNINQLKLTYTGGHVDMMEGAWRAAWQTEPVFRTEICLAVGCGAQVVHKRNPRKKRPKLEVYHCRQDYETAVGAVNMAVGLSCGLELLGYRPHRGPLETAKGETDQELTIVLTAHHSLMDGSSLRVLLDRVERAAHGWSVAPSPSPVHANLGLISAQRSRDVEARAFFASYLKDIPPPLNQKTGTAVDERHCGATKTALLKTSAGIDEVTAFAAKHCLSVACIYYTAWAMSISVLERNPQVVVGAVFSSREALQPEHQEAVGLYMSTLPLVFRFHDADETVVARLQRTMHDLATVGEYAWARSDQAGLGRRLRNLLSMQLPLPDEHSRPPVARVESLENLDFPLSMLVEGDGRLRMLYDETEFDSNTIRRVGEHFKHALCCLLRETRVEDCMRIGRLQETLLEQACRVRLEPREGLTVKKALEEAMGRFAELTALEDCSGTTVISYGELETLTRAVAQGINQSLLLCGDVERNNTNAIAVYGDGTAGWVLGLLGIVRTGRTFVPLDPKWPADRRAAVCKQSGATALMLVSSAARASEAPVIPGMRVLAVESILSSSCAPSNAAKMLVLEDKCSPDSDLFMVFTSGTTGTPKGVPVSNRSFLALLSNPEATMFAAPGRRIAQFMSPAFDVCNAEIFAALLHGATLVLRDPLDPLAHLARVNTATITPSVLAILDLDRFPGLETVYATGEPTTSALVDRFGTRTLFYNAYGPAECSVWASVTRMIPGDRVTVGTALETARMYVLDQEQRPSPDGIRGEIYLAGVQVLRGYVNSPTQTAESILPDPWYDGERMYRTGDYGMRGRDGRVVYIGRIDRQVKIRGSRVELSGVEQAILSGPADERIAQCAAIAIHGTLVAFVTLDNGHHDSEEVRLILLRKRLAETLLPSSVPQIILPLVEFPRNANGKTDTRALEAAYASKVASHRSSVPSVTSHNSSSSSHMKGELAAEWRQILQLEHDMQIEDSDDFISLGGHSVLVMLLAARLTSRFGVDIPVRQLLPASSFQDQADLIRALVSRPIADDARNGPEGISHETLTTEDVTELERQVWFQYQVATLPAAFNIAAVLDLQGTVDLARLVDFLDMALASDPVLRSNFVEGPGGPRRRLRESAPHVNQVTELDLDAEASRPFDLENDELFRVYLIVPRDTIDATFGARLAIVTSHVIADMGTLQGLLQLTSNAYAGTATTNIATNQQLLNHLNSDRWTKRPSLEAQMFWKEYLRGHECGTHKPPLLPLSPSSLPATFQGTSRTYEFSGELVFSLNVLIRRLGVTHHQLALAAAALTLQWLSQSIGVEHNDIVLGAPNAGRPSPADHQALGQFLDRLPVRVKLHNVCNDNDNNGDKSGRGNSFGTATTTTVLTRVRDSARTALANAIPFSDILSALGYPRGDLRHPLFECMVTFHKRSAGLANWLQLPGGGVTSAAPVFVRDAAKFPLMLEWFELDTDDAGAGYDSDRWMLHVELQGPGDDDDVATIAVVRDALGIVLRAVADECSLAELRARLDGLPLLPASRMLPGTVNGGGDYEGVARSGSDSGPGHLPPAVVELATKIRAEMVACLGETNTGTSIQMSLDTSLFEAGADSNAAIVLRHRLRQNVGVEVSARDIFAAQSPLKLAQHALG